jgi:hypothetical protein
MDSMHLDDDTVFNPETGEFGMLPKVRYFFADRYLLVDDSPATIFWSVEHASNVWLNGQPVERTGSSQYHGLDPTSFTLLAQNESGITQPEKIDILIDKSPPVIHSFSSTQTCAVAGHSVHLAYRVTGAVAIEINGNHLEPSQNEAVLPQPDNGLFILRARSYFGVESVSNLHIMAVPVPLIKTLLVPTPDFVQTLHLSIRFPNYNGTFSQSSAPVLSEGSSLPFVKLNLPSISVKRKVIFSVWVGVVFDRLRRFIQRQPNE